MKLFDIFLRDDFAADVIFLRSFNDLVIHVSEVPDVVDLVAAKSQISVDNIKGEEKTAMTEMRRIVHAHTADIHFYLASLEGNELLLFTTEGVENFQCHTANCKEIPTVGSTRWTTPLNR